MNSRNRLSRRQERRGEITCIKGAVQSTSDFWQPWQCLNSIADRLKLVMAVKRVHVNGGVTG
jgi:hypothetical protein